MKGHVFTYSTFTLHTLKSLVKFSGKEYAHYMSSFSRRGILATSKNIL